MYCDDKELKNVLLRGEEEFWDDYVRIMEPDIQAPDRLSNRKEDEHWLSSSNCKAVYGNHGRIFKWCRHPAPNILNL